jgi:hypothetical protein
VLSTHRSRSPRSSQSVVTKRLAWRSDGGEVYSVAKERWVGAPVAPDAPTFVGQPPAASSSSTQAVSTVPTVSTPSSSSTYSTPGTATTSAASNAGSTKCDANITAGPATSCPFAENVFRAVAAGYQRTGQIPSQVTASSPVTGQSYRLTCNPAVDKPVITCTTPSGAIVGFSIHSVQVY